MVFASPVPKSCPRNSRGIAYKLSPSYNVILNLFQDPSRPKKLPLVTRNGC
ncbi:hypothetical protein FB595_10747 [Sphingobium sp. AEW010]|nr:hypothetical protein [Sphingobium sp. JAI105]TWD07101.1 hypothetical protein FB595_10747 [Sphingobium sp. AEW010]TWD24450.1 hypothetical protein FB596_107126 [Sphingobium sp. AEW013]TWD26281.1 hypothetical protein FB594_107126 [Sphingobium sp. AEW001]